MCAGENTIVIVGGANDCLNGCDVARAENVIRNSKVVLCQLEISPSASLAALRLARSHGGQQSYVDWVFLCNVNCCFDWQSYVYLLPSYFGSQIHHAKWKSFQHHCF